MTISDVAAQVKNSGAKILIVDIERLPGLARIWDQKTRFVHINNFTKLPSLLCVAAKWYGSKQTEFLSVWDDADHMVKRIWEMYDEADIVVTYNGVGFDIPHIQREFLLAGLTPPKPFKQIDLLRVVRKQFRFASNKLDFISQQLGIGHKTSHEGFALWVKCMEGDEKAWARMARYCKQDVKLTEKLYHYLLPWLTSVPHIGQMDGAEHSCWACGGTKLTRDGTAFAFVTSYRLYSCNKCGAWVRGSTKLQDATTTRQQRIN